MCLYNMLFDMPVVFLDDAKYCGAEGASGVDFGHLLGFLWGPATGGVT